MSVKSSLPRIHVQFICNRYWFTYFYALHVVVKTFRKWELANKNIATYHRQLKDTLEEKIKSDRDFYFIFNKNRETAFICFKIYEFNLVTMSANGNK